MKLSRLFGTALVLGSLLIGGAALSPHAAHGTDLQDSASLVAHPAADINDVYLYPAPGNSGNVVMMMTVNAGLTAAAAGNAAFDPAVLYQFKLAHTSGLASSTVPGNEDTVFQFLVSGSGTGQSLTMYGPAAPNRPGSVSTIVATNSTAIVPFGKVTTLSVADDALPAGAATSIKAFAGLVTDPGFFDLTRFYALFPDRNSTNHTTGLTVPAPTATSFAGFNGTPCDTTPAKNYFKGLKTLAIVLEMPKSFLKQIPGLAASSAQPYVHLWATTSTVSGS